MNYINSNKKSISFKKIRRRYINKFEKSEMKDSLKNNLSVFNIHNSINNIKSHIKNLYDRDSKDLLLNYKNIKKCNIKCLSMRRNSNSTNNIKLLDEKSLRNIRPNFFSRNKKQEEKEDNNKDSINKNGSIPTILKIQKLIESLKGKNTNSVDCHINYSNNKENYKFPELIKKSMPSLKNFQKSQQKDMNNISIMFSIKDKISNRINKSKIKLKQIQSKENKINNNINGANNIEDNTNNKISQISFKIKKKKSVRKIRKPKITLDKVKNIIKENLIIDNNGNNEKIVNIRLKMKSNQKSNINHETIIIKTKKENTKLLLSNFSNYKFDLMTLKKNYHHFEDNINKKDILFNKNKTMFKNPLNDKKYNEEDKNECQEDSKNNLKYYLPSSGFGLLNKLNE